MILDKGPQIVWVLARKGRDRATFIKSEYSRGTTAMLKDAFRFRSKESAIKHCDRIEQEMGVGWCHVADPRDYMKEAFGFRHVNGELIVTERLFPMEQKVLDTWRTDIFYSTILQAAFSHPMSAWKSLLSSYEMKAKEHRTELMAADEMVEYCKLHLAMLDSDKIVTIKRKS